MKKLDHLNETQFHVTQENGTEKPFENEYWDFFDKGIYVDIVSGEVLFSSEHKYESSCGWPSFYKSLEKDNIVEKLDKSHAMTRVEVRSKHADSHLGHLFTDGPAPTGIRYCINSAALRFIPKEKLKSEGYEQYLPHFNSSVKDQKLSSAQTELATLGAGCFWGVEAIFKEIDGVLEVTSGYSGGEIKDPSYEEVCTGKTGHAEVIQFKFDPSRCSFETLLDTFFRMHDPTTPNQQGPNLGTQYRSVIFYHHEKQKEIANNLIRNLEEKKKFSRPIITEVEAIDKFYPAEEFHQNFYGKKYGDQPGPICHFLRKD